MTIVSWPATTSKQHNIDESRIQDPGSVCPCHSGGLDTKITLAPTHHVMSDPAKDLCLYFHLIYRIKGLFVFHAKKKVIKIFFCFIHGAFTLINNYIKCTQKVEGDTQICVFLSGYNDKQICVWRTRKDGWTDVFTCFAYFFFVLLSFLSTATAAFNGSFYG